MRYNSGIKNYQFDILHFDLNYPDSLYNGKKYYGNLSKHLKVVLTQHITEIELKVNFHKVYETSGLLKPYNYSNNKVKKVNK